MAPAKAMPSHYLGTTLWLTSSAICQQTLDKRLTPSAIYPQSSDKIFRAA
ncbi:MAG: hypothetical protein Q4A44_06125 [Bacteroidales bacterium]|nr:hypothetical protein [Bacteroidales bacterium]